MEVSGLGVTDKVVSIRQLKELKDFSSNGEAIVWLRVQGFTRYDNRINFLGVNHTVWFRGIAKSKVNKAFRKSMVKDK